MQRVDHQILYSNGSGVYSNAAEEFFSRMRRAEIGHHHHIAGTYLSATQEAGFSDDARHIDKGTQVRNLVALALAAALRGFLRVLAAGYAASSARSLT
jgi:hypothetical protein